MPTGVYTRTEKHSFNKGRKHVNRKKPVSKGITPIEKTCAFCKNQFITNCFMPNKKYCSQSCRSKDHADINLYNLSKIDREYQKSVVSSRTGSLHPRWIKDRSTVKLDKYRGGPLHKQWSKDVKKRDKWKCKIHNHECSGRLESHHIRSWKYYPELRYDVNNGITLCHYHHPRKRSDELRLITLFENLLKTL